MTPTASRFDSRGFEISAQHLLVQNQWISSAGSIPEEARGIISAWKEVIPPSKSCGGL